MHSTQAATPTTTTTTTKAPATKVGYLAAADAICKRDHSRLKAIEARIKTISGEHPEEATIKTQLPPLVLQAVAIERADIEQLRGLPRPPADVHVIAEFVIANEEKLTDETNFAHALASGEAAALSAAETAAKTAKVRARALGEGYGVHCGAEE